MLGIETFLTYTNFIKILILGSRFIFQQNSKNEFISILSLYFYKSELISNKNRKI